MVTAESIIQFFICLRKKYVGEIFAENDSFFKSPMTPWVGPVLGSQMLEDPHFSQQLVGRHRKVFWLYEK